jgi:hypothetical protein
MELEGVETLGAYQLLEKYDVTPQQLFIMHDNTKDQKKISTGVYASTLNMSRLGGPKTVVLNGFYPHQLNSFNANESIVVALELSADMPFDALRTTVLGAADPAQAEATSVRGSLLAATELPIILGANSNGCHMSSDANQAEQEIQLLFGPSPSSPAR